MIPYAISPVHIDVVSGEIPDLNNGKRAEHIDHKSGSRDEPALHLAQQRVVPSDDIDKDQVIDQFEVLYLFFFFLQFFFLQFFLLQVSFPHHENSITKKSCEKLVDISTNCVLFS